MEISVEEYEKLKGCEYRNNGDNEFIKARFYNRSVNTCKVAIKFADGKILVVRKNILDVKVLGIPLERKTYLTNPRDPF